MRRLDKVLLIASLLSGIYFGSAQAGKVWSRHGDTPVVSVRFSAGGNRLVSASFNGTVAMWDGPGKLIWRTDLDERTKKDSTYTISEIQGMDLSPDGRTIAVSYSRGHVVGGILQGKDEYRIGLLDSNKGSEIRTLTGHSGPIGRVAFSPNGTSLLSESADNTARLWDVNTGQEMLLIKLKERGAAVSFSPNGKSFAVATQPVYGLPPQAIVGLYDSESGRLLREFPRRRNTVTALAFSPDGESLAIATGDAAGSEIDLWEPTGQEPKNVFVSNGRETTSLAFSFDGRLLASGGFGNGQGIVEIRNLGATGQTRTHRAETGVTALAFSSDGKRLVAGTDKGQLIELLPQPH